VSVEIEMDGDRADTFKAVSVIDFDRQRARAALDRLLIDLRDFAPGGLK
jgi:hypothetical protein